MDLDQEAFDRALADIRLELAVVFDWDPTRHPRDLNGRWRDVPDFDELGDLFDRNDREKPDNTQDLHTVRDKHNRWHYTKERNALHKAIIKAYLDGKTHSQDPPKMLFTAGGAGSGKTEGLKKTPHLMPAGAVLIDPDEIKLQLPEYKKLVEEGNPKAATLVHDESIDIAQKLLWAATEGKYNTLMDGTGASPMFINRIETALDRGYDVHVAYFNTNTETALRRIAERKARTGRAVREDIARTMHRMASVIFEDVYNLGTALSIYDTTGPDPELIAHADGGSDLEIEDAEKLDAFLGKAKERPPRPPVPNRPPFTTVPKGKIPTPANQMKLVKIPPGVKKVKPSASAAA